MLEQGVIYTDPIPAPPPIMEPREEEPVEFMPFPQSLAQWWKRVTDGKSGAWYYSEAQGWYQSDDPAEEVDHIQEESKLLHEGQEDPNHTTALPLSIREHRGQGIIYEENGTTRQALPFEEGWSKHPDMHQALQDYRAGDKEAFKKAAAVHHQKAQKGEPISNMDEGVSEWYTEFMNRQALKYALEHPEDPQPKVKNHPKFKRKHWTDGLF